MTRTDDNNRRAPVADTLPWPQIERTPPSVLYAVALVVVAAAMVLLPVIYAALIACAAYATYWHLTNDTWILDGSGSVLVNVLAYFGPAVAAAILLFFMVKPFFARSTERE